MADTGTTLPGTAATDADGGVSDWTNPNNIKTDDANFAWATTGSVGD